VPDERRILPAPEWRPDISFAIKGPTLMPKPRGTEVKLSRLRELRTAPVTAESVQESRQALGDVSNLVVAEAAAIAGMKQV
jgi:hypothetical protein